MSADSDIRAQVRERYAAAAREAASGGACGCGEGACCQPAAVESGTDAAARPPRRRSDAGVQAAGEPAEAVFGPALYDEGERGELPEAALLASLGCGNPTAVAELREGEVVLDLGSGGGIDVLLSARRVGPTGRAYGLDMTEEMLALARRNAREAGAANVEFLKGHIEEIPMPAETVDVVISNCVVNLSPDKAAVLGEVYRVLVPGGRVGISDVVADDALSVAERAERGSWSGCIAGALSRGEYERLLAEAGFEGVAVEFTHEVEDGMHGAIVRAVKPVDAPSVLATAAAPGTGGAGCC
jgi:SAM-dependent methyltransferase